MAIPSFINKVVVWDPIIFCVSLIVGGFMDKSELGPKQLEDEKIRRLQWIVQLTYNTLCQEGTTLEEAVKMVEGVKHYALKLFPGKERAWKMIYAPRFRRVMEERWGYVPNEDTGISE